MFNKWLSNNQPMFYQYIQQIIDQYSVKDLLIFSKCFTNNKQMFDQQMITDIQQTFYHTHSEDN